MKTGSKSAWISSFQVADEDERSPLGTEFEVELTPAKAERGGENKQLLPRCRADSLNQTTEEDLCLESGGD